MIFGKNFANVVASIYEAGDVANVVYYSPNKPLALVPKSFFVLKPGEGAGLSNSQKLKRTISFTVGEEVEFELVPGSDRIVQWIRKSPEVMNVFLSQDNFVAKSTGIIAPPNVKQDGLWTKEFGWVPLEPEQLGNYEPCIDVPMNITIVIDINFGIHDNAKCFMLDDFKPTCSYKLLSIDSISKNREFLCIVPWKKNLDLVTTHDLAPGFEEESVKSEDTISDRLECSYSANSMASSNERSDLRECQVFSSWNAEQFSTDDWTISVRYVFNIDKLRTEKALRSTKMIIGGSEWQLCINDIGDSLRVTLCCNMDSDEFSYDTNARYVLFGQKRVECEFKHCYASNRIHIPTLQYLFEQLSDSANGHINDDNHVTVLADFSFKRVRNNPIDVQFFSAPPPFRSDCVLVVEDKRLHVNKVLLSVYSAYFDELFNGDPGKNGSNEIVLTDVSITEFVAMLSAIYPTEEQLVITESNVRSMLKMAARFRIPFITGKCEKFLMTCPNEPDGEGLTLSNKLFLAQGYRLNKLKNWCISHEEFEKLDANTLRVILKNINW
ncbi:BTB/POZ domain-containing protein [Ditylenchus destructor]|uniref:BTB/POZ domain-containing protein n=1 Tax=Ditylenchus destructor TaxID=166010 RepID=A0AAD4R1J4_9BILA|nr:BTB/POZ domain-containing protein [Ditylenchus destructor]